MNFNEEVEKIKSKQEFIFFIQELSKDFISDKKHWENHTIDNYLQSMAAWVEDMEGYYRNLKQKEPELKEWGMFAKILLAAKYYE